MLELDSTIDEVKPALAKIEVMLQQSRSKVLQYNAYEATYGFPISEYYDLVAAEKNLIALKTVWKSTEEWESMYTRWAGTEFSQLHVEELKVIEMILFNMNIDLIRELFAYDLKLINFTRNYHVLI